MKGRKNYVGENRRESFLSEASGNIKNFIASGSGNGTQTSIDVGTALAKTMLRRLPPPFNLIAPLVAEKVIVKYGVEGGREILLKGLRWIKKATDEKPLEMVM